MLRPRPAPVASLVELATSPSDLMARVTDPQRRLRAARYGGHARTTMATLPHRSPSLVQLSIDACTASRRIADREGRSVPAAIVNSPAARWPSTRRPPAQRRCPPAHAIDGRDPDEK